MIDFIKSSFLELTTEVNFKIKGLFPDRTDYCEKNGSEVRNHYTSISAKTYEKGKQNTNFLLFDQLNSLLSDYIYFCCIKPLTIEAVSFLVLLS